MRKALCIFAVGLTVVAVFFLAACGENAVGAQGNVSEPSVSAAESASISETTADTLPKQLHDETETTQPKEENVMKKLIIEVGDKTFTATLYDNETVTALAEMLPLTLNMSELNGNEKYYYLGDALPTDPQRPSGIKEGDIMLYGSSCLVLFYESFSTSYSYTPIGHIDDPSGLAETLGRGSAEVTFSID